MGGYEFTFYKYTQVLAEHNEVTLFTAFDVSDTSSIKKSENAHYVKIKKRKKFLNRKGVHGFLGGYRYLQGLRSSKSIINGFDLLNIKAIPYIY